MKIKLRFLFSSLPLLALLVLDPGAARAAVLTWDGSANGLWTNAANWTPAFRPTNGDALFFPDGVAQTRVTNSPAGATNYHSITIAGSNYFLRSPFLALTNGLTNSGPVGAENTVAARVVLRASQRWEVAAKTRLVLASNVSFTNLNFTIANEGHVQFSNTISGGTSSVLSKTNDGEMEIVGAASMTHLIVQEGELAVNGSLTGALTIDLGAALRGTGSVPAFATAGQVQSDGFGALALTVPSGTAAFSPGSTLRLSLNGTGTNHTQLRVAAPPGLSGASLSLLLGYSPLLGDSFVIITNTGGSAFASTFAGRPEGSTQVVNNVQFRISYVGGSGNDVTLTVVGFNASATTRVWDGEGANAFWQNATNWSNNFAPAGGHNLVFPSGAAQLASSNNFPASTAFNALHFDDNGFDLRGNSLLVLGGVRAAQAAGGVTVQMPLTHSGLGTARVEQASASLLLLGEQTLDQGLIVEGAGLVTLSNRLRGPNGLSVLSPARLNLAGNFTNDFAGGVQIFSGAELGVGAGSSLGLAGQNNQTVVLDGGLLSVNTEQTNGEHVVLSGRWRFQQNALWPGAVTITTGTAEIEVASGRTGRITGAVLGTNFTVVKTGPGALALASAGVSAGTFVVSNGTLLINNSQPALDVQVVSGVAGGTGTLANLSLPLAGFVRPGVNRTGTLTCSNLIGISPAPVFQVDVTGPAHTRLRVLGSVQLNGNLVVDTAGNPSLGVPLVIIDNAGPSPVSGTFFGVPEGSSLVFGGLRYRVSYIGGDGNDVALELISVTPTGIARVWDAGGTDNFWSNPTNWSGNALPEPGDTIVFPSTLGPSDFLITNDLLPGLILNQVVIREGGGGSGTQVRGNAIGLLNGVLATNTSSPVSIFVPLLLAGPQTFSPSVPSLSFGDIVLNGDLTFGGDSNVSVTVLGEISGAGGLDKTCAGQLILSGQNSFDGPVRIFTGSLVAGENEALGQSGGGTFMVAGTSLVLGHPGALTESFLSIAGLVSATHTNTVLGEIALPDPATSFSISPTRQLTLAGPLTGVGGPLVQGGGRLVLAGTNFCASAPQVQNATLIVNGRSEPGEISVGSGGVLGGTGVVGRVIAGNNATINPGVSPGLLTSSDVTLAPGSTLLVELNGPNAGVDYDQLNVLGPVTLGGGTLALSFGFTPPLGSVFTIIQNDGVDAVSGIFPGWSEGATLNTNGMNLRLSYVGGDGNDVTLTRVLIPSGVTRVWDGGGANNSWTNRFNWVGDVLPVEGDRLHFPSGAPRLNNTNDFPPLTGFDAISVGGAYTFGGAPVLLQNGLTQTNATPVNFNLEVQLNAPQAFLVSNGLQLILNRTVTLGAHTLTFAGNGAPVLNGPLAGGGGVIKTGSGTLTFNGTNTYDGVTDIQAGTLAAAHGSGLGGAGAGTVIRAGATLRWTGAITSAEPITLEGQTGNAATLQSQAGTSLLTGAIALTGDSPFCHFDVQAGELRVNGSAVGGGLTKVGAGTLVLNGGNTYSGTTRLEAGTLLVNGTQPFSPVVMSGGSTISLGGTGTVGTVSGTLGTVNPGLSPGRLIVAGDFTGSATRTNFYELNGPVAGSGYDQLVVQGNVALNSTPLRLAFGYTPAFGDSFVLIDNQGLNPIGGTFAGLPEGSWLTNGPVVTRLTYQGGTGNDVMLTRVAVPTLITRLWDGGGADSLWSNPLNWAGDIVPQQGDDVVLPGTVAKAPLFDAGTNVAYNTLLLGRAYSINVTAGHSMRLINALTTTNTTGVVNLHVPVTLQNNQLWAITHPGATLIQRGPLDLGFATLTHLGAGSLSLTARVTGSGGLSGNSSGLLQISGTNDFTGTVTVNSGELDVQSPGALGSTLAGTFIGTAGRISMGLANDGAIDEPLTLAGRVDVIFGVTNIWNGPVILAGTQTAFDTLNAGALMVNGPLFGGGWQTLGIGSLVLNSPASYGGPFRVGGGARVFVNENHSAVFFALTNTSKLGGTGVVGQISATTCAGCEITPGALATPGALRSSSVTLASGAALRARVNGPLAATDYDQLDVAGTVTLTGASLIVAAGFNPGAGLSFTLINNDGADAVTGTFINLPAGALLTNGAVVFEISYTGGDGNDVVLTRVIAAPPSTIRPVAFSNGVPVLGGTGLPNVPYVLEATETLNAPIPWQPILTNTTDGAGAYQFLDFVGTNFPMRFYRVLSP